MNFTVSAGLVCDLICLGILLATALRYRRLGLLGGIVNLVGNLASLGAATFVSRKYAGVLFSGFLRPSIEKSIAETISSEGFDPLVIAEKYGSMLPKGIRERILEEVMECLDPSIPHAAEAIVTQVVEPLILPLLSIVLFFVVYTVCRFLVSLLVTVLSGANHIPLAGGVNRSLGTIFGVVAGAVDIFIFYCVAWSIMVITGGKLPILDEALFAGSSVFALLSRINPFI